VVASIADSSSDSLCQTSGKGTGIKCRMGTPITNKHIKYLLIWVT